MKRVFLFLMISLITTGIYAQRSQSILNDTIGLDEIVVTGSRVASLRENIPIPISVVNNTLIERTDEAAILPILMKQVPGLFVTSKGVMGYGVSTGAAGGISMRGLAGASGRILILIDGHPQYATIYGHPVADSYNTLDAERIEVSHGSASVLYGSNAMGGTINIITKKVTEEGNHIAAKAMAGSYGSMRYTLSDSYKKNNFTAYVGGGYEKTDGHRPNSKYNSTNGFIKLGQQLSKQWKVTADVSATHFYSDNPGDVSSPMLDGWANVLRGMSGLSFENDYGKTKGAANFYYNWGKHKINDGYREGGTPQPYLFNSTDYMGGVNLYQSVDPFKGNTITGGFDVKLYGGNAYRNPETEIYADHIKLNEVAGYISIKQVIQKLTLSTGLRLENHSLYGLEWVPQAGLTYKAFHNTSLRFSFSKGFRTPNMRELYMYAVANEDLLPEESLSYDFSITQKLFKSRMSIDANLYYMTGKNIIEVTVVDGIRQNRNAGEFTNKGVELSVAYQVLDNLRVDANYSYLHMKKTIVGSPRNMASASVNYTPGKFSFYVDMQLVDQLFLSTGDNAVKSDYTIFDARIGYKPVKWLELFVNGDNIFGKSYQTMLGFPMPKATFLGGISVKF